MIEIVYADSYDEEDGTKVKLPGGWHPRCIEDAPGIFFACHEARAEVCKSYKPLRGTVPIARAVFCDLSNDYLFFNRLQFPRISSDIRSFFRNVLLRVEIRDAVRRVTMDEWSFQKFQKKNGVRNAAGKRGDNEYKLTQLHLDEFVMLKWECPDDHQQLWVTGLRYLDHYRRTYGPGQVRQGLKKRSANWRRHLNGKHLR